MQPEHLQAYLDEFTFRFNRRPSAARGMLFYRLLELAAAAPSVTPADLAVIHQPKKTYSPGYVGGPRACGPASLVRAVEHHPWRRTLTSTSVSVLNDRRWGGQPLPPPHAWPSCEPRACEAAREAVPTCPEPAVNGSAEDHDRLVLAEHVQAPQLRQGPEGQQVRFPRSQHRSREVVAP